MTLRTVEEVEDFILRREFPLPSNPPVLLDLFRGTRNFVLIRALRESSHALVRRGVCKVFRVRKPQVAREALLEALIDSDDEVRVAAMRVLESVARFDDGPTLLRAYDVQSDFAVQFKIVETLGRIRFDGAEDFLITLLDDFFLRAAAAKSLKRIGVDAKIPRRLTLDEIERLMLDDRTFFYTFPRLTNEATTDQLIQLMHSSESSKVRQEACIHILNGRKPIPKILDAFVLALEDPDEYVRDLASECLWYNRRLQDGPAIRRAFDNTHTDSVRIALLDNLVRLGHPDALRLLLEMLEQPDRTDNFLLIDLAAEYDEPVVVDVLSRLLETEALPGGISHLKYVIAKIEKRKMQRANA